MNKQSPLYKAIEARGGGRNLSPDFSSRLMCEIRVAEHRRRRREMWWSIIGYVMAAIVVVATLAYTCGDIFIRLIHNFTVDSASVLMALMIAGTASLLLALDYFLRKKLRSVFVVNK